MNSGTLFTIFIVVMVIFILSSLAAGLYYLVHDRGKTRRVVNALTVRIGLSILLFILLFLAFAMGWITPHGLLPK